MCRLDDQEGLVRKNALEILTPLEDSQQDSEPECLQDVWRSGGINKHQSTNLCNVNVIILFYAVFFCCLGFFYYCYISVYSFLIDYSCFIAKHTYRDT